MSYKDGSMDVRVGLEYRRAYGTREYRIPELEEAYQDDETRAMGYGDVKKNYIYTGKDDKMFWKEPKR